MNETVLQETLEPKTITASLTRRIYFIIKRLFDIFTSLIGILFLLPISLVIKICALLTGDTSPILFTQNRIGKNGKEFKCCLKRICNLS